MIPPIDQIDPQRYLALIRALADEGNVKAQHNLGAMYLKGLGVERNPVVAAEWFAKAGEQGDIFSQHNLALLYLQGIGVAKDLAQAVFWMRRAACQGDAKSAHCLGALYFEGVGVSQDFVQAYIWLSRALLSAPEYLQAQIQEALDLVSGEMDPQAILDAQEHIVQREGEA